MVQIPALPALVALVSALLVPGAARAQARPRFTRPAWHVEAGVVAFSTPWVKDDNGTEVNGTMGPSIGAGIGWAISQAARVGLDARVSRGGVTIRGAGNGDIDGGHTTAVDLLATLGATLTPRLAVHGGVGTTHLSGSDEVAPFAAGNDSPWRLGAEAGAQLLLSRRWPVALTGTVHGMRVGSASANDPVSSPGAVTRLVVGVRYGR